MHSVCMSNQPKEPHLQQTGNAHGWNLDFGEEPIILARPLLKYAQNEAW